MLTAIIFLVGCSTSMQVTKDGSDEKDEVKPGIPFRLSKPVLVKYNMDKHSEGGNCQKTQTFEIVPVSGDELYYFSIDPGQFADASLSIKYHENGFIQEINMNTKPDSSAIDSTTDALATLLPYAGILPKEKPTQEIESEEVDKKGNVKRKFTSLASQPLKSCNAGKVDVKVAEFKVGEIKL